MPDQTAIASRGLTRWLAPAVLLAIGLAAYGAGLHRYLSFEAFVQRQQEIEGFVASHPVLAVAAFMAAYVAVVALSLPGAALMSIAGGFLFGWQVTIPATVIAATLGATVVFQVVKTSFGAALAARAGGFVQSLSAGFARNAFSYLLFLRLVPAFPFFAVNAVAGLCNVRVKTFIGATLLGIIPGSAAFCYLGTGLGSIIDAQKAVQAACLATQPAEACPLTFDVTQLLTRELAVAFVILGLVALLPTALRRFMKPQ